MERAQTMGELRSLLHREPSEEAWTGLMEWLMSIEDDELLIEELIPYAHGHLDAWSEALYRHPTYVSNNANAYELFGGMFAPRALEGSLACAPQTNARRLCRELALVSLADSLDAVFEVDFDPRSRQPYSIMAWPPIPVPLRVDALALAADDNTLLPAPVGFLPWLARTGAPRLRTLTICSMQLPPTQLAEVLGQIAPGLETLQLLGMPWETQDYLAFFDLLGEGLLRRLRISRSPWGTSKRLGNPFFEQLFWHPALARLELLSLVEVGLTQPELLVDSPLWQSLDWLYLNEKPRPGYCYDDFQEQVDARAEELYFYAELLE